jgi:hypothetical protein
MALRKVVGWGAAVSGVAFAATAFIKKIADPELAWHDAVMDSKTLLVVCFIGLVAALFLFMFAWLLPDHAWVRIERLFLRDPMSWRIQEVRRELERLASEGRMVSVRANARPEQKAVDDWINSVADYARRNMNSPRLVGLMLRLPPAGQVVSLNDHLLGWVAGLERITEDLRLDEVRYRPLSDSELLALDVAARMAGRP